MSPSTHHSDTELVRQCNTGGRDDAMGAFEVLYARHKDYVVRVALRYLHDADLALDVLQDTFSYLLKKFPPTGDGLELTANLRTLLHSVAKNQSISILRKNSRVERPADFDPDEVAAPPEESRDVSPLLAGLSHQQREIIQLRFVDDLPLADIANILDVPIGTVKSRLHGAVRKLRNSRRVKEFFEK